MKKSLAIVLVFALLMSGSLAGFNAVSVERTASSIDNSEMIAQLDQYDLLIITPAQFSDKLESLKQHKEQHDVQTIVVTLDDIYNSKYFPVQGRDDAEKVKYFIKNAYDEWDIIYVLLVGGRRGGLLEEQWWCPVRYSYCGVSSDWESSFLSDLYFADIYDAEGKFSSWDIDGNDVFGEWKGDGADDAPLDLKPDVYVGRWPVHFASEVDVMVTKTIEYENTAYGQEWYNRMVCIAGDTYPEFSTYEGELGTQRAMNWMPGFSYMKLWTSDGTLTGVEDVINAINGGCGFLFFDGHGNPMGWATHPPNDADTWIDGLYNRDMKKMSNTGEYPVCIVGGCHNSQFNVSILNVLKFWEGLNRWRLYFWKGETAMDCWSWKMTKDADSGAIATLGYSALGYTKEDKNFTGEASEWLDTHFFWEFGMNKIDILGEIWGNVISGYLDTYPINWSDNVESPTAIDAKTAQEWILIGDPSLKMGGYPN